MKAFALGGYGKVGLAAVRLLADSDLVSEIAIAGRRQEYADKAAVEIGKKAIPVCADGTDQQELARLLKGYDIIMHSASRDSVIPSIRAAMHAEAHYCDASTFDFVDQVLPFAAEAESARINAIIATGIRPCISNLMGVYIAQHLELVDQRQLGCAYIFNWQNGRDLAPRQWRQESKESLIVIKEYRPFIAMTLQMVKDNGSRTVCTYHKGEMIEINPIKDGINVPMANGGTITAYPYISVDPIYGSLPSDTSRINPVEMQFSPLPPQFHYLLRDISLRLLAGEINPDTATSLFYDTVESDPHRWLSTTKDFRPTAKMWTRAIGHKEGRAARCSCWLTASSWDLQSYFLTSVALAIAVLKILRGEIRSPGVITAEKAFEPISFLDDVGSLLAEDLTDDKFIDKSFEWLE